jgi:hypothetical protein
MIFVLRREVLEVVVWEEEKSDELSSRLNGSDDHAASWTDTLIQLDIQNDFHDLEGRPEPRVPGEAPMEGSCLLFKRPAKSGGHRKMETSTAPRVHLPGIHRGGPCQ